MPSIDTFLFDLDGTLIDSLELILRSYRHTLSVFRGEAPADETWMAGLGTPLRTQLAAFARDADELDRMAATYREYNFAHHDDLVRQFPGIREAVTALKAQGHKLAIVTSKARSGVTRGLRVCGLDDLFGTIVTADDTTKHKPDPTPVLRALEILGSEAGHAVFIGDSPHDMAAAAAAHILKAAALWGPFGRKDLEPCSPDIWLAHPAEIADFATWSHADTRSGTHARNGLNGEDVGAKGTCPRVVGFNGSGRSGI